MRDSFFCFVLFAVDPCLHYVTKHIHSCLRLCACGACGWMNHHHLSLRVLDRFCVWYTARLTIAMQSICLAYCSQFVWLIACYLFIFAFTLIKSLLSLSYISYIFYSSSCTLCSCPILEAVCVCGYVLCCWSTCLRWVCLRGLARSLWLACHSALVSLLWIGLPLQTAFSHTRFPSTTALFPHVPFSVHNCCTQLSPLFRRPTSNRRLLNTKQQHRLSVAFQFSHKLAIAV